MSWRPETQDVSLLITVLFLVGLLWQRVKSWLLWAVTVYLDLINRYVLRQSFKSLEAILQYYGNRPLWDYTLLSALLLLDQRTLKGQRAP